MDELARILLQKEGEPAKDSVVQTRPQAGGKRAIGKAVAKGGLLLKGKNPGNVNPFTSVHVLRMTTLHPHLQIQRQEDDNTSIFGFLKSSASVLLSRLIPRLLSILYFLGFERVRGRNRPRDAIPSHALCFLIREHYLE